MQKLMIPVALALATLLAGCGKNDNNAGSSTASGADTSASTASSGSSTGAGSGTITPPPATSSSTGAAPASGTTTPDTSAAAGGNTPAGASGATTTAAAGGGTAAAGASGGGQQVFSQTCVACHGAGVAGAPKVGDKTDWGPRIAQGKDTLYQHAINGYQGKKGLMPPKGGNTTLADADVKSAVDYLVAQAK